MERGGAVWNVCFNESEAERSRRRLYLPSNKVRGFSDAPNELLMANTWWTVSGCLRQRRASAIPLFEGALDPIRICFSFRVSFCFGFPRPPFFLFFILEDCTPAFKLGLYADLFLFSFFLGYNIYANL